MTQIQHYFRSGQTEVHYHNYSTRIQVRLAALMRHGSLDLSDWQRIPDTPYEVRLRPFQGTECLVFKLGTSYSYISVFRLPNELPDPLMKLVAGFYEKHELGKPLHPVHPLWIHSFPVHGSNPRATDLSWMHEMILLVYYTKLKLWMDESLAARRRYFPEPVPAIPAVQQELPKTTIP